MTIRIYYFTMGFLAGLLALSLSSCGPHQGANVTHAVDCFDGCNSTYKEKVDEFRGADGTAGAAGADGNAGADGAQGVPGPRGVSGVDGAAGADGQDGEAGTNCTLTEVEEGVIITCGPDSVLVEHGEDADEVEFPDYYCIKIQQGWQCYGDAE